MRAFLVLLCLSSSASAEMLLSETTMTGGAAPPLPAYWLVRIGPVEQQTVVSSLSELNIEYEPFSEAKLAELNSAIVPNSNGMMFWISIDGVQGSYVGFGLMELAVSSRHQLPMTVTPFAPEPIHAYTITRITQINRVNGATVRIYGVAPEPSAFVLFGLGLHVMAGLRRTRRPLGR